jgi:hypothetical protein
LDIVARVNPSAPRGQGPLSLDADQVIVVGDHAQEVGPSALRKCAALRQQPTRDVDRLAEISRARMAGHRRDAERRPGLRVISRDAEGEPGVGARGLAIEFLGSRRVTIALREFRLERGAALASAP